MCRNRRCHSRHRTEQRGIPPTRIQAEYIAQYRNEEDVPLNQVFVCVQGGVLLVTVQNRIRIEEYLANSKNKRARMSDYVEEEIFEMSLVHGSSFPDP